MFPGSTLASTLTGEVIKLTVSIQQEMLGYRVQGSVFRVQGAGFRVQDSGFRVQGSGFTPASRWIGCMVGVSGGAGLSDMCKV